METITLTKIKWQVSDLELLPDNNNRYEIINGELYMTRSPHWNHQNTQCQIYLSLQNWANQTGLGRAIINPDIVFSEEDNVIPDVIWISKDKLNIGLDNAGHLTIAPELIIEVLSQTPKDIKRDKEVKLKLYSNQGVREYWIVDWRLQQVYIYRRQEGELKLLKTLFNDDIITSDLFPDFSCQISDFFA